MGCYGDDTSVSRCTGDAVYSSVVLSTWMHKERRHHKTSVYSMSVCHAAHVTLILDPDDIWKHLEWSIFRFGADSVERGLNDPFPHVVVYVCVCVFVQSH